jgi:hypothetical protein
MEIADYYGKMSNAELSDFLSRPVNIATISWTGATTSSTVSTIYPWNLFFDNNYIQYKLHNYSFLRCKLKVKVVINASPFFYGAMLVTYSPLEYYNPLTTYASTDRTGELIQKSQLPHLWIFPQNNQGGELTLPFLYHKDWIPISGTAGATNLTRVGTMRFDVVSTLQSANGALSGSDVVNLQVYAWAEDVEVSGPTVAFALQSSESFVKEGSGFISGPASAIANVASKLTSIPIIGKWASAFKIGGSAVAGIARLFGFTDVPNIKNVDAVAIRGHPDFATQDISYPVQKLTLDPKNELSIDPGIIGSDRYDMMSLAYLIQHETFLGSSTWAITDAADDLLFASLVTPTLAYTQTISGSYTTTIQTPIAFASTFLKYWRGDIVFKFVIVSSKYHKGRLRFTFDPTGNSTNNILNTTDSTTVTYTQIIDLSDQSEFEVTVPYHQALPFLKVGVIDSSGDWGFRSTPSYDTNVGIYHNGYITLRVLTALTAPVDTADVSFLVFVRGAENLEFAYPMSVHANATMRSHWVVQSSDYYFNDNAGGRGNPLSDKYTGESFDNGGRTKDNMPPRSNQVTNMDYNSFPSAMSRNGYNNRDKNIRGGRMRKNAIVPNSEGTLEVTNESAEIPVNVAGQQSSNDLPERYLVNFGERILSLRQLFHRKSKYRIFQYFVSGNNPKKTTTYVDKHPVLPGYQTNACQKLRNAANTSDVAAVIAYIHPMAWYAPAYIGYRGSVNWYSNNAFTNTVYASITSFANDNSGANSYETITNTVGSRTAASNVQTYTDTLLNPDQITGGAALQNIQITGAVYANVPMMTNYKFKFTNPSQRVTFNSDDNNNEDILRITNQYEDNAMTVTYVSAGPDYSLCFFRCVPFIYNYPTPLVSTT